MSGPDARWRLARLRRARHLAGMVMEALVRANLWAERHKRLVAGVTVAAFALTCAHYARFIRLPEIIALPVVATGLLTGLRYALWDGWLKRLVEARTRDALDEPAPASPPRGARTEARTARPGETGPSGDGGG